MLTDGIELNESGIECFDAQRAMLDIEEYQAYLAEMVIKCIRRRNGENGVEGLLKARKCIDILIKEIEVRKYAD
jgi:hypothetical protein